MERARRLSVTESPLPARIIDKAFGNSRGNRHRSDQIRERRAAPQLHRESAIWNGKPESNNRTVPIDSGWVGSCESVNFWVRSLRRCGHGQELLKGDYIRQTADDRNRPCSGWAHQAKVLRRLKINPKDQSSIGIVAQMDEFLLSMAKHGSKV